MKLRIVQIVKPATILIEKKTSLTVAYFQIYHEGGGLNITIVIAIGW